MITSVKGQFAVAVCHEFLGSGRYCGLTWAHGGGHLPVPARPLAGNACRVCLGRTHVERDGVDVTCPICAGSGVAS